MVYVAHTRRHRMFHSAFFFLILLLSHSTQTLNGFFTSFVECARTMMRMEPVKVYFNRADSDEQRMKSGWRLRLKFYTWAPICVYTKQSVCKVSFFSRRLASSAMQCLWNALLVVFINIKFSWKIMEFQWFLFNWREYYILFSIRPRKIAQRDFNGFFFTAVLVNLNIQHTCDVRLYRIWYVFLMRAIYWIFMASSTLISWEMLI